MNNSGNIKKIIDKTKTLSKRQVWTDKYVSRMPFKKLKHVYLTIFYLINWLVYTANYTSPAIVIICWSDTTKQ